MQRKIIVSAGITAEQLYIFKELYLRRNTWIAINVVGAVENEEKNIVVITFPEGELEFLVATLDLLGFKLTDYELINEN